MDHKEPQWISPIWCFWFSISGTYDLLYASTVKQSIFMQKIKIFCHIDHTTGFIVYLDQMSFIFILKKVAGYSSRTYRYIENRRTFHSYSSILYLNSNWARIDLSLSAIPSVSPANVHTSKIKTEYTAITCYKVYQLSRYKKHIQVKQLLVLTVHNILHSGTMFSPIINFTEDMLGNYQIYQFGYNSTIMLFGC